MHTQCAAAPPILTASGGSGRWDEPLIAQVEMLPRCDNETALCFLGMFEPCHDAWTEFEERSFGEIE